LGRDLIALDDLLVGDLLAVGLGHPLVPDARAVARAKLAEAHGLPRHGAVELHGHVQEPEADRSAPNRPSHRLQPEDRRNWQKSSLSSVSQVSPFSLDTRGYRHESCVARPRGWTSDRRRPVSEV